MNAKEIQDQCNKVLNGCGVVNWIEAVRDLAAEVERLQGPKYGIDEAPAPGKTAGQVAAEKYVNVNEEIKHLEWTCGRVYFNLPFAEYHLRDACLHNAREVLSAIIDAERAAERALLETETKP